MEYTIEVKAPTIEASMECKLSLRKLIFFSIFHLIFLCDLLFAGASLLLYLIQPIFEFFFRVFLLSCFETLFDDLASYLSP